MSIHRVPSDPASGLRTLPLALAAVLAVCALRALALPAAADIDAVVTADNAYSFGWGSEIGVFDSYQGASISTLAQHFAGCPAQPGPNNLGGVESYAIPAGNVLPGRYFYLIAYSDDDDWQGVLGSFSDSLSNITVTTGDPRWEVCAVGMDFDGKALLPEDQTNTVPSEGTVTAKIRDCNAWTAGGGTGPASSSGGWVSQAGDYGLGTIHMGGPNDGTAGTGSGGSASTAPWGPITCIPSQARWMWFNADPSTYTDPIRQQDGDDGHKEFLIFRLPMESFLPCPSVVEPRAECIPGPFGPSGCYQVTTTIVNDSGAAVDAVLVQGHDPSPSVLTLTPPLGAGESRDVVLTICPDAKTSKLGVASLSFRFPGAHDCCERRIEVRLPDCGELGSSCLGIPRAWATCVPEDANAVELSFELDPMSGGGGVLHLGGGAAIEPDLIPLPAGDTHLIVGPLLIPDAPGPVEDISTGEVTRRFCTTLYMSPTVDAEGATAGTCCHERVCFDLPICGLPATPVASDPGGTPDPSGIGNPPAEGRSR